MPWPAIISVSVSFFLSLALKGVLGILLVAKGLLDRIGGDMEINGSVVWLHVGSENGDWARLECVSRGQAVEVMGHGK